MIKFLLLLALALVECGGSTLSRSKRALSLKHISKWEDAVVPYEFGFTFNTYERNNLTRAINAWQTTTCVRFRPRRSSDRNWIRFVDGSKCFSNVGRRLEAGVQNVILARKCRFDGVMAHELGHVLGLLHEHNRLDRNSHIHVNSRDSFNKQENPRNVDTFNTPYDFQSIMHYGMSEFPSNLNPRIGDDTDPKLVGHVYSKDISFFDAKAVNTLYGCFADCPERRCEGVAYQNASCVCEGPGQYADRRCKNSLPDDVCNERADRGHCNLYKGFMRSVCRKSCNTCFKYGSHGVNTRKYVCRDFHSSCKGWANRGECRTNPGYMNSACPLSCNICEGKANDTQDETSPPTKVCRDLRQSIECHIWKRTGNCENPRFSNWMQTNCYATCSGCGGNTVPCRDIENVRDCQSQRAAGYCDNDNYRTWMITNCFKTCTQCTENPRRTNNILSSTASTFTSTTTATATFTTTTTTPGPLTTEAPMARDCRDNNIRCPRWARGGECDKNPIWMKANCQYSCNSCRNGTACRDLSSSCRTWASRGECTINPNYMRVHCKMSCNLCPCVNTRAECPERPGECRSRAHYRKCRGSCNFCVPCKDTRVDCIALSRQGYCRFSSLLPQCPFSCRVCA